ncbi:hypothetical protein ACGF7U_26905 [Micromonospora sp. NPDC047670]|uniref:effector-associated constant component EACC1 n=1 Tax=Micromonospora sp. NPDC047670 TaxID=3364252 RepID=UPI0037160664
MGTVTERSPDGREVVVRVRIAVDGAEEIHTLYVWLRSDLELARGAEVCAVATDPTRMGALEVIDVVLTQATSLSALALAVVSWRQSRSRPEPVTITRPDGGTLTIGDPRQVDAEVIRAFLADDATGPGEGPRQVG